MPIRIDRNDSRDRPAGDFLADSPRYVRDDLQSLHGSVIEAATAMIGVYGTVASLVRRYKSIMCSNTRTGIESRAKGS